MQVSRIPSKVNGAKVLIQEKSVGKKVLTRVKSFLKAICSFTGNDAYEVGTVPGACFLKDAV